MFLLQHQVVRNILIAKDSIDIV